jgi:hypothetical protein
LDDEAKALLGVEELDDTLAFANDLRRHLRTRAAAETAATAAATESVATATKAIAATAEAITAAAETIAATKPVTAAKAAIKAAVKIVALVKAATATLSAPPSIKTHPSKNFLRNRVRPDQTNSGRWTRATEIQRIFTAHANPTITQNASFR